MRSISVLNQSIFTKSRRVENHIFYKSLVYHLDWLHVVAPYYLWFDMLRYNTIKVTRRNLMKNI